MNQKHDLWMMKVIGNTPVIYPMLDLFPHDKASTQCRCLPTVTRLANGCLMISHNMMMRGTFFPTSGKSEPKPDELIGFSVD